MKREKETRQTEIETEETLPFAELLPQSPDRKTTGDSEPE